MYRDCTQPDVTGMNFLMGGKNASLCEVMLTIHGKYHLKARKAKDAQMSSWLSKAVRLLRVSRSYL